MNLVNSFVAIVAFESFDDCVSWAHKKDLYQHSLDQCFKAQLVQPANNLAPMTSLRPKARPTEE